MINQVPEIEIKKPGEAELKSLGVNQWSPWSSEVKTFDWEYDAEETCYFLEGRVRVRTEKGVVEVKKGDLARFAKGLRCTWEVLEPVKKVYTFEKVWVR